VEGATVGPADFVFTTAADVIRGRDLPREFAAVLSGHIHRHQVLTKILAGARLPAPVLYPGSIERTSTAEIGEPKGYMMVELAADAHADPLRWQFHELPARPMLTASLPVGDRAGTQLESALRLLVMSVPADAVLVIRILGDMAETHLRVIAPAYLRSIAPPSMNIEIRAEQFVRSGRRAARRAGATPTGAHAENLQLDL
jgi:DNA repair exonuclease SbcCD nuclease subunit